MVLAVRGAWPILFLAMTALALAAAAPSRGMRLQLMEIALAAADAPAAKPAATPPAKLAANPPAPVNAPPGKVLHRDLAGLLGHSVQSRSHENMGQIVDILVSKDGAATAAVIDFGGFLGVGSRRIAVDWHAIHFPEPGSDKPVVVDFTLAQLTAAPNYEEGKPVTVLRAATVQANTPKAPAH